MGNGRININLPKVLNDRFEQYCVKVTQKHGKIIDNLRAKIGRAAVQEFLDNHENDLDIEKLLKNNKNKG